MTDVSFVIPAWNEAANLPVTLGAIRESMAGLPWSWEAVVADNASDDGTAEIAAREGARVVHEPFRQIARVRNRGASEARGRYLLFVDADTQVTPDLVRRALGALDSGGVVGGGALLSMTASGRLGRLFLAPWLWASPRLGLASGAFVFCRREAWEAVGGFDERVYASEEIWFSRAVKRWGRARGLRFEVFPDLAVETSGRKLEGWGALRVTVQFVLLTLCPWLTRSRRACFLWYRR